MNTKNLLRNSPERRQRVQSVEMGMTVLKALGRMGGVATLSAISAEVDEMPPKVHRYLASLVQEGLVAQEEGSQRYRLGPEVIHLGLSAMKLLDPVRVSQPVLAQLCEQLGLTAILVVMGNMGPTVVRWEEPLLPVTVNVRVGSVMPMLWSASGRVFLAYSADEHVRQIAQSELDRAIPIQRALLDRTRPIEHLNEVTRAHGCSVAVDTLIKGMAGISAPIFDFSGRICGAIAVMGTEGTIEPAVDGSVVTAVKVAADQISQVLGYIQKA